MSVDTCHETRKGTRKQKKVFEEKEEGNRTLK